MAVWIFHPAAIGGNMMKGFERNDLLFSLCGLNCGLCAMNLGGYCPGCGGGEGNQACAVARCSMQKGQVEYCFQCNDFPCGRYQGEEEYDSFITHRNRMRDLEKMREAGAEAYGAEQKERVRILHDFLDHYNDGRRKNLYCLAANLLELEDLQAVQRELRVAGEKDLKERAGMAAQLLQEAAKRHGVVLKLRKKPPKKQEGK